MKLLSRLAQVEFEEQLLAVQSRTYRVLSAGADKVAPWTESLLTLRLAR